MLLVCLPTAWWNYQVPQKEIEMEKESAGLLQKSNMNEWSSAIKVNTKTEGKAFNITKLLPFFGTP